MRVRIAVVLRPHGDVETFRNHWESDMRFWHTQYPPEMVIKEGEYHYYYACKPGSVYALLTSLTGYVALGVEHGELAGADIVVDAEGVIHES